MRREGVWKRLFPTISDKKWFRVWLEGVCLDQEVLPGWVPGEPLHGDEEDDAAHDHFAALVFFVAAEPVDESEGDEYGGGEAADGD